MTPLPIAPAHKSLRFVPTPMPTNPMPNHHLFMAITALWKASDSAVPSTRGSTTLRTVEHKKYPNTNLGNLSHRKYQLNFFPPVSDLVCHQKAMQVQRIPRLCVCANVGWYPIIFRSW